MSLMKMFKLNNNLLQMNLIWDN